MIETLNDFNIGNNTNMGATENGKLEQKTNGLSGDFEKFVDCSSQNQVNENDIDDKIRRAGDGVVLTVENRMHDAILTAMDKVLMPRVATAVRSSSGSIGHGPTSGVQNPDRRDFTGNTENTPLMSAFSRLDLNIDQDRIGQTRDTENFEDGGSPALKPNYDWRAHAHCTCNQKKSQ